MNQEQIRLTLDKQTHAWNAGDIDRFMQDYVQSNELTFISDGSIQRGWNATYERYKRRYPDKSTMGTVTFSDTEVYMLNDENAFVIGKWHVGREVNPIGGRYTLVMQKRDNRWVIIHDHTSTAREALSPSE